MNNARIDFTPSASVASLSQGDKAESQKNGHPDCHPRELVGSQAIQRHPEPDADCVEQPEIPALLPD